MSDPTQAQLFGSSPFVVDPAPGGVGPWGAYAYNKIYFATLATAQTVAKMLGGVVEEAYAITPFGPFKQNQPNLMVRMPILAKDTEAAANGQGDDQGRPIDPKGRLINAGIVADLFGHGYMQINIDKMIMEEVGFEWHYQPSPPEKPVVKPVAGVELLVAPVGGVVMQADGTFWKRVKDASGK